MSVPSVISMLDLNTQLPFAIDADLRKQLCFDETLVVSCSHVEGNIHDDGDITSEWTCTDSTAEADSAADEEKADEVTLLRPAELEQEPEEAPEDQDNNFYFYFFPDCTLPPAPVHSATSVITVNGLPQINVAAAELHQKVCTCDKDRTGTCTCHTKLPCYCGAKSKTECTCKDKKDICICNERPAPVCKCPKGTVCVCFPDRSPNPVCVCDTVERPCICDYKKFPSPICRCDKTPSESTAKDEVLEDEYENAEELKTETESTVKPPCECQIVKKKRCFCQKGKKCVCNKSVCTCGIQKTCVCEESPSLELPCASKSSFSICSCPAKVECTCDTPGVDCKCFPQPQICTCEKPEECTCLKPCSCIPPCICGTRKLKGDECECISLDKVKALICTCPQEVDPKKLKRKRTKEGYRWCHDVDPKHTFFDYGYDMHHKISDSYKEAEMFKILGLHDKVEKYNENECPIHGIYVPKYKKTVKKPTMDCCSAVGGITISVETLGETEDKFLIQVVSNATKEGGKTSSRLVSIVDLNLHTMEENRVEHMTKNSLTKEFKSYLTICDTGYYNKITRICGDKSVTKRMYHSYEHAYNFLLEGANIVLMRYMAINRYRGAIKTDTVLMNGTICESIYNSLGVNNAIVNNKTFSVVKIERHIIEPSGVIHQTMTVLSLRGYIVNHEWANSPYLLHINPLLEVNPQTYEIEKHAPLRERWRQDLQLMSDYLDFKSARTTEGACYIAESGELTAYIRDYLQTALMLKPHDVLNFTRHYFSTAMSSLELPQDQYFDPTSKHVRYFYFEE